MNKADVFSRIYRENHWASAETRSGVGSEMGRTQSVRERLPWLWLLLPEDELDPNAPFNPGYLGLWRLGSDIDGLS